MNEDDYRAAGGCSIYQLTREKRATTMGTWGPGPFDNNHASDFVADLSEEAYEERVDAIRSTMGESIAGNPNAVEGSPQRGYCGARENPGPGFQGQRSLGRVWRGSPLD